MFRTHLLNLCFLTRALLSITEQVWLWLPVRSCVLLSLHTVVTHVFGIWEDWGLIVHWRCCCCFLCVMQCHHHHHQQWWGVVQTTGWYQVKAVHLPAAERQIHNQTLVNEKHGHIQKQSSLLRLSFSVSFSMWYFCTFYYYNTHTHLISLPLCTSCKYINWPFCYKETIFSVNMYMYLIDKVTKCHFLWNGDQCKVLLNRKVKNQSISKLWTTELSRVPFWD